MTVSSPDGWDDQPAGQGPKVGVRHRPTQVADAAERFLAHWMKHRSYEPAVGRIVRRDPDGAVEVLFVKGEHPRADGRHDRPGFAGEVMDGAARQDQVPRNKNLWWIFCLPGRPTHPFAPARRLVVPSLQIHLARQQVNVAGLPGGMRAAALGAD